MITGTTTVVDAENGSDFMVSLTFDGLACKLHTCHPVDKLNTEVRPGWRFEEG